MPLILVSPYKKIVQAIIDAYAKTYATLNPNDKSSHAAVLSDSNLHYAGSGAAGVRSTVSKSSGKWYWEATLTNDPGLYGMSIGIAGKNAPLDSYWNSNTQYCMWYCRDTGQSFGQIVTAANSRFQYGAAAKTGDTLGFALDLDNLRFEIFLNGVAQGKVAIAAGTWYAMVCDPNAGTHEAQYNFGQKTFQYKAPDGFNSGLYDLVSAPTVIYCTLSPTDKAQSATIADKNLTYSGSGGSAARGTIGKNSGKWYYEATIRMTGTSEVVGIGIATADTELVYPWNSGSPHYLFYSYTGNGGTMYSSAGNYGYGPTIKAGDVIGVAVDMDNLKLEYFVNGVSAGVISITAATYYPMICDDAQGQNNMTTLNFGATAFKYSPPKGFNIGFYSSLTKVFGTLSPTDKNASASLSQGNLFYGGSSGASVRGTLGKSSGKFYWEAEVITDGSNGGCCIGIANSSVSLSSFWNSPANMYVYFGHNGANVTHGEIIEKGNVRVSYGDTFTVGAVIGVLLDLDNKTIEFTKNGVKQGPITIAADTYFPFISDPFDNNLHQMKLNFGAMAFKYAQPSGFEAYYDLV